jgi:hypothetical protein
MAPLSDLLHRFRRFGTPPGPPSAGLGVPARPGESLAAELLPLFSAVDEIEAEAQAIAASAEPEAERVLAAGREEAARISADGTQEAERARAQVAAASERETAAELARIAAAAELEVARIAEVSAARRDALVRQVVERVRGPS